MADENVHWIRRTPAGGPPELRDDPETKGILAGRFKRQWLKTQANPQVGFRAYDLYCTAFEPAKSAGQADQVVYNGVNAAYLGFALGEPGYKEVAEETLAAASGQEDYWSTATRAECLLLLGRHEEALAAYRDARRRARAPRHWTSTGQQALDILARQGNPPDGTAIQELFRQVRPDFG